MFLQVNGCYYFGYAFWVFGMFGSTKIKSKSKRGRGPGGRRVVGFEERVYRSFWWFDVEPAHIIPHPKLSLKATGSQKLVATLLKIGNTAVGGGDSASLRTVSRNVESCFMRSSLQWGQAATICGTNDEWQTWNFWQNRTWMSSFPMQIME